VKFSEAMSSMWLPWRANSAAMAEWISGSRALSGVALIDMMEKVKGDFACQRPRGQTEKRNDVREKGRNSLSLIK